MKKTLRILALSLALVLLLACFPMPGFAADGDSDYVKRVFSRYRDYSRIVDGGYSDLTTGNMFMFSVWMDRLRSKSFPSKAVLWATDKLTDHDADQEAYSEYLVKLLAMHEKGYMATLAAQAKEKTEALEIDNGAHLAKVSVDVILDISTQNRLVSSLKAISKGIDIAETLYHETSSVGEVYAYTLVSESYADKIAFLSAIRDNAGNRKLRKAAEELIEATDLEFAYLFSNVNFRSLLSNITDAADFTMNVLNLEDSGRLWELAGGYITGLAPWAANMAKKAGFVKYGTYLAGSAAKTLGLIVQYFPQIQLGFALGGLIGNLVWGADLERYQEIEIMYEISNALSKAIDEDMAAAPYLQDAAKYERIRRIVACGEALAYARLRGETCYIQSRRDKRLLVSADDAAEEEAIYERNRVNCLLCSANLERIFPDAERQVVVVANPTRFEETKNGKTIFSSTTVMPKVFLPDAPEVADAINNNPQLRNFYVNVQDSALSQKEDAVRYYSSGSAWFYDVDLTQVYSVPGGLSMQFMEYIYSGGAHPQSARVTFNYSLEDGQPLHFLDMLSPANPGAEDAVIGLYTAALEKELPGFRGNASSVMRNAIEEASGYSIWFFGRDGITFEFSPYDLAEYARGYVTVTVPYLDLAEYLLDAFIPINRIGLTADGEMIPVPDEQDLMSMTFYGPTTPWGICPTGTVFDLQIGPGLVNKNGTLNAYTYYCNFAGANDLFWLPETLTMAGQNIVYQTRTADRPEPIINTRRASLADGVLQFSAS